MLTACRYWRLEANGVSEAVRTSIRALLQNFDVVRMAGLDEVALPAADGEAARRYRQLAAEHAAAAHEVTACLRDRCSRSAIASHTRSTPRSASASGDRGGFATQPRYDGHGGSLQPIQQASQLSWATEIPLVLPRLRC